MKKRRKQRQLDAAIRSLNLRFGPHTVRQVPVKAPTISRIGTGFSQLDKLLVGGLPRGYMTELVATPTSGMTTVALKAVAQAQAGGDAAAYLDLGHSFDGDYAHRCDVDLSQSRFLLIRPERAGDALDILQQLVVSNGIGILVFVPPPQWIVQAEQQRWLAQGLRRLGRLLPQSSCAVLWLTMLDQAALPGYLGGGGDLAQVAALRLLVERGAWDRKKQDIRGYQTEVKVIKNRFGPAGKGATIRIRFNGTVRGDGT